MSMSRRGADAGKVVACAGRVCAKAPPLPGFPEASDQPWELPWVASERTAPWLYYRKEYFINCFFITNDYFSNW